MRFLIASALLASAAIATPAFAQDSGSSDKPFQGVKIVATTGIDHVTGTGDNATGLNYGGTIGYDYQAKNIVLGVEGEVSGSTAKDCRNGVIAAGDRLCLKSGRDLYAGARLGVVVGEKALLYVKGGYANGRLVSTYDLGATHTKVGDNADGWRAGAGAEMNFGKNLIGRVEYRYTNYSDTTFARHQGLVGLGVKF